ncbi:hypothetical protein AMAG_00756 [Allomyces macrogynus ATCC 38327]|uniref:Uncharacterized protein n=1 Tax=Allomyces macrogynus (strain ATCC 38327) TaxID=578462 RepID=A0A0L0RWS4_ALLM3|nr:hypothetical protein AMAG_00756 [Allomyces macrogynus ATCC 38327]|eukprot:KNE54803.1 hypothetical protein AMAG_00756 [Allomyces macrogynus ATCC 38327]
MFPTPSSSASAGTTCKKAKSQQLALEQNWSRPNVIELPVNVQNGLITGPMAARKKFLEGLERNQKAQEERVWREQNLHLQMQQCQQPEQQPALFGAPQQPQPQPQPQPSSAAFEFRPPAGFQVQTFTASRKRKTYEDE